MHWKDVPRQEPHSRDPCRGAMGVYYRTSERSLCTASLDCNGSGTCVKVPRIFADHELEELRTWNRGLRSSIGCLRGSVHRFGIVAVEGLPARIIRVSSPRSGKPIRLSHVAEDCELVEVLGDPRRESVGARSSFASTSDLFPTLRFIAEPIVQFRTDTTKHAEESLIKDPIHYVIKVHETVHVLMVA
jgi:hypothetical protein